MQALYQWHMAGASLAAIEAEFRADYDFSHVDLEYFQALLHGCPRTWTSWRRRLSRCSIASLTTSIP